MRYDPATKKYVKSPEEEAALHLLIQILRPLKRPPVKHPWDDELDHGEVDDDVRDVVRAALTELNVDGHGGCLLCMS